MIYNNIKGGNRIKLNTQINDLVKNLGADFFGVADITPAYDFIISQRKGFGLTRYPRSISIGIALMHSIVDQLPQREDRTVAINYLHHAYTVVNQRLDLITSRLSSVLQKEGYSAYPIPASKTVDNTRICGEFSHKLAAHLAGLGWIGKNCLLITPEMGPRVRWGTVLTDAPLTATGKSMESQCADCLQCVKICPVNALTGIHFRKEDSREVRFDAAKCEQYFNHMQKKDVDSAACGLCLYICPYGENR